MNRDSSRSDEQHFEVNSSRCIQNNSNNSNAPKTKEINKMKKNSSTTAKKSPALLRSIYKYKRNELFYILIYVHTINIIIAMISIAFVTLFTHEGYRIRFYRVGLMEIEDVKPTFSAGQKFKFESVDTIDDENDNIGSRDSDILKFMDKQEQIIENNNAIRKFNEEQKALVKAKENKDAAEKEAFEDLEKEIEKTRNKIKEKKMEEEFSKKNITSFIDSKMINFDI